ncbi:MAG: PAS domain-containing protein [Armatimonadota bacterium]
MLLAAIIALWITDPAGSYESLSLALVLSLLFSGLVSLFIISLLGRSFQAAGAPNLLLLGCGVLVWGLAGVMGIISRWLGAPTTTIHNSCVWVAALFHLAGVLPVFRPGYALRARGWWLAAAAGASLGIVAVITVCALAGWLPVFFIPGQGGTPVRVYVLGTAIAMFGGAAVLLGVTRRPLSPFAYWYRLGLVLMAVGLFGVLLQSTQGSLLNWTGRAAQFLSGVYLLVAAVAALRESRLPLLPMPTESAGARYPYAVALIAPLVATAARLAFLPALGAHAPYILFYPAVMLAALYGGLGPGLLATALSALLADYFWLPPSGRFVYPDEAAWLGIIIFILSGALLSWFADIHRRAQARALAAEAEARMAEERAAVAEAHARLLEENRQQRQLLEGVLETAPIGVAVVRGPEHRYEYVNSAYQAIPGTVSTPMIGRALAEVFPDLIAKGVIASLDGVYATGQPVSFRSFQSNVGPGREQTYWDVDQVPLLDAEGQVEGILILTREVTERIEAEAALRESHALLDSVLNNTHMLVASLDRDFNFRLVNQAYARADEQAPSFFPGKNHFALYPNAENEALFRRVVDTGEPLYIYAKPFEYANNPERGVSYWDWSLIPVRRADGQVDGVVLTLADVTARIQAEQALRESEARMQMALHVSRSFTFEWDPATDRVERSESSTDILGLPDDDARQGTGQRAFASIHPEDRARFEGVLAALTPSAPAYDIAYRLARGDGATIVLEETACGFFAADGALQRLIGVATDITERKAAEAAIERERDVLTAVMDGARNSHLVCLDRAFNFVRVNETYARSCGYRPEEMIGKNHFALYPDAENEAIFARVRDTGEPVVFHEKAFEFPDQPERGVTYWDWTLIPIRDAGDRVIGLVLSLFETTERVRAEQALRESRARLAHAEAVARLGHWEWDLRTGAMHWSPEIYRILELPTTVPPSMALVLSLIHSEDQEAFQDALALVLQGENIGGIDLRGQDANGNAGVVHLQGEVTRDAAGRPIKLFGILQDITARKQAEEALKDADRAKDEFLSILSHELLTPVTSMLGWAQLALKQPSPEMWQRTLEVVQRNARRQKAMVNELLDVSRLLNRKVTLALETLDLRELAGHAATDLQVLAAERRVTLTCESEAPSQSAATQLVSPLPLGEGPGVRERQQTGHTTPSSPTLLPGGEGRVLDYSLNSVGDSPQPQPLPVRADPVRLRQCLDNLLQNALKFTPPDGTITVACARDGDRATVTVRDTGRGIAPEALTAIFQPFRQVERDERTGGLGLGLAITRGLVELHGGALTAASDGPGQGSAFTISLPLWKDEGGKGRMKAERGTDARLKREDKVLCLGHYSPV